MKPFPTLSPFALILLPFVASMITGTLQHKELPHAKVTNTIISAAFFMITSLVCWLFCGSIADDPSTNFFYYSAILAMIFNTSSCKALNEVLVEAVPSPFLLLRMRKKEE